MADVRLGRVRSGCVQVSCARIVSGAVDRKQKQYGEVSGFRATTTVGHGCDSRGGTVNAGAARLLAVLLVTSPLANASVTPLQSSRQPMVNPERLILRCQQVAAVAHPWRAKQIDNAIVRYRLAMAYRSTLHVSYRLPELAKMRAAEIRAADNLEETCQIVPRPSHGPASIPPLPPN